MITFEEIEKNFPNFEINEDRKEIIDSINQGRCFLNIIGKAGSGKSVTLSTLKQILECHGQKVVVCGSTGVASALLNSSNDGIKACTIHSTFGISPKDIYGFFEPSGMIVSIERKKKIQELIEAMDYLFVDEVSMCSCDFVDYLLEEIRYFRHGQLPSIIFFNDVMQLSPVVKLNDETIKGYYKSMYGGNIYYYNSNNYKDMKFKTIELKKIYRQGDDKTFADILNNIRIGKETDEDLKKLNERVVDPIEFEVDNDNIVKVCSTNKDCNIHNEVGFDMLDTEIVEIPSVITGNFKWSDEFKTGLYPEILKLREGLRVMITKNAPTDEFGNKAYVNGDVGVIVSISDKNVVVELKDRFVSVEKVTVSNYEYELGKNENGKTTVNAIEKGSFTNFPLKIAYSSTVHKLQGTTLDKGIIDVGWTTNALIYVALSRFRHLEDFCLIRPLSKKDIKVSKESLEFLGL